MGTAQVGGPRGNVTIEYLWLCDDCWAEGDETFLFGSMPTYGDARCSRCRSGEPVYCADVAADEPRPARGGWQMEFSTSLAVTPWPYVVWDVNGYYHELGIRPDASRREIREAYDRLDGQSSSRLTFIVKQLLDPEVRHSYDASDLGTTFIDEYVVRWITQQMADDARQERLDSIARGEVPDEDEFEKIDLSHLVNRSFDTVVDRAAPEGHAGRTPAAHGGWGFYRWKTGVTDYGRVSAWRNALTVAANERSEQHRIAVGIAGGMESPVEVLRIGFRVVAFLSAHVTPTERLAHEALDRVNTITALAN